MRRVASAILILAAAVCLQPGTRGDGFGRDRSFDRADADRDGFVSWGEYRDSWRDGSRGHFSRMDRDGDGSIGRDEWDQFEDRRSHRRFRP